MLRDLNTRPLIVPTRDSTHDYPWDELAFLWNSNDMAGVHDWLNRHWADLIQSRLLGQSDPEAQFLQGLAFAALALFFTQQRNQEGALLMLDDALVMLAKFRPHYLGVRVDPVAATLEELRPLLVGLAPDAECPLQPFVYRKFEFVC
ncbi:MAG: DUF309 domain-containing protein [Betaproteobacteria bacterium]|nr:DUF309 domain-containing protein [Betaproteobacteria bacterium]